MSSHPPFSPDDRDWLAAEFAMGLADSDARAAAERLLAGDPAFRAEVARWSGRLTPMLDEVAPIDPPAHLLAAIEQRLQPSARIIDLRPRLRRWQMATGGMTALAASLGLALILQPHQAPLIPPPAPPAVVAHGPMVAMLQGGPNRLVASWDGSRQLMVVPAMVATSPHRAHELWMIPKDGKPRSMGVMPAGPMKLDVQPETAVMLAEGAVFAVSLEPMGGSPTGQPTGPVIASGALVAA